jgi:hypothetical protein
MPIALERESVMNEVKHEFEAFRPKRTSVIALQMSAFTQSGHRQRRFGAMHNSTSP